VQNLWKKSGKIRDIKNILREFCKHPEQRYSIDAKSLSCKDLANITVQALSEYYKYSYKF